MVGEIAEEQGSAAAVHQTELVGVPTSGRVFSAQRRCRIGDCAPTGRLRLDSVARYLQDVAYDDYSDAGFADEADATWVARRVTIDVHRAPRFEEIVHLRTFASALASRWAERRVSIRGEIGGRIEAAVLWVYLRRSTGSIAKLPDAFVALHESTARGRTVRARFRHDPVAPGATSEMPWPTRVTDLDVLGHINNAAYWAVLEEVLEPDGGAAAPLRVEIEHRQPVESGVELRLVQRGDPTSLLEAWLVDEDEQVAATFQVGPCSALLGR